MLALVTPPVHTALTTVAMALAEVGSADTGRMTPLVAQASRACEGFCGRPFGRATWTETFFGSTYPLVLSRTPIVSVASVAEWGNALDPSDYLADPESGVLTRNIIGYLASSYYANTYYAGGMDFAVIYTAGYLMPDDGGRNLPEDIERACLEVVKMLWFTSGSGARDPSIRSESIQGIGSTSYLDPSSATGGLPVFAASLLTPYRQQAA